MEHKRKRKGMKVRTGGSRRVEAKDQESKPGGAKKRTSKKSAKSKLKGGENGAKE